MAPESLAIDSVYEQLRSLIVSGYVGPGQVVVVQRLAQLFGISISPIRDALQRMVGERLVEALPGGGFRVPVMSHRCLRDLYNWHLQLVGMAIRDRERAAIESLSKPLVEDAVGANLAFQTARLFEEITSLSSNLECTVAVHMAGQRLNVARMIEASLEERHDELLEIWEVARSGRYAELEALVSDYHNWRLDRLDSIIGGLANLTVSAKGR